MKPEAKPSLLRRRLKFEVFTDSGKDGISYLLADYEFIANFRESQIQTADRRVDVLLTLASAFVAGVTVLFSVVEKIDLGVLLFGTAIAGLVVLCLGMITFGQILHLTIATVEHTRAINRIRYFFTQHSPYIQPYVLLPVSHQHPPYNMRAGGRRIVAVVNSMCASVIVVCLTTAALFWNQSVLPTGGTYVLLAAFIAVVVFGLTYNVHEVYARRVFKAAETKASSVRSKIESLYASGEQIW